MSDIIDKLQEIIDLGFIDGCATTDRDIAKAIDEIKELRAWRENARLKHPNIDMDIAALGKD